MKDKYYIPEVDEFRYEFVYYTLDKNSEISYPYESKYNKNIFNEKDSVDKLAKKINYIHIRVKYLDEQDIEELGFECIYDDIGLQHYKKEDIILKTDPDLGAYINASEGCLYSIYYSPFEGQVNRVFAGIIKNKSELKQILKMLGI